MLHGNGPAKTVLNSLGNYVPDAWNKEDGCTACWEDNLDLDKEGETPQVVLAVFVEQPTPFLQEFLEKLEALSYPRSKVDLFLHSAAEFHDGDLEEFLERTDGDGGGKEKAKRWNSVTYLKAEEKVAERTARNLGIHK